MLTQEENELLTRTGPGTPAGELLRRYWQPAALSEELPAGGAPLPVRLIGEDLVLFRDAQAQPGLLGLHCSHRGADLSYGRLEDGGLRCIYHGWLYDVHGRCLEQPGEPATGWTDSGGPHSMDPSGLAAQTEARSRFHEKIQHKAYPCVERAGMIFAYLGPGEPPLLPNLDFLQIPEDHVSVTKIYSVCNYLQGNEGNIDLLHLSFLHYSQRDLQASNGANRPGSAGSLEALHSRGSAPYQEKVEARLVPVGLRICKIRTLGPDQNYLRMGTFIMPNSEAFPAGGLNWHVPIDDTHHWKYVVSFSVDRPLPKEDPARARNRLAPPPDYKPVANIGNRYLQSREAMKAEVYSGISGNAFAAQDLCVTEGAGPIQDRTQEHLAPNDAPIAIARTMLAAAIKDVQEGRDPPGVIRDSERNYLNIVATYGIVPSALHWYEHGEQLLAKGRGWIGNVATFA